MRAETPAQVFLAVSFPYFSRQIHDLVTCKMIFLSFHSTAVIWQNLLSPLLHFSRKSSFGSQVFLRMFLIADFLIFGLIKVLDHKSLMIKFNVCSDSHMRLSVLLERGKHKFLFQHNAFYVKPN